MIFKRVTMKAYDIAIDNYFQSKRKRFIFNVVGILWINGWANPLIKGSHGKLSRENPSCIASTRVCWNRKKPNWKHLFIFIF